MFDDDYTYLHTCLDVDVWSGYYLSTLQLGRFEGGLPGRRVMYFVGVIWATLKIALYLDVFYNSVFLQALDIVDQSPS